MRVLDLYSGAGGLSAGFREAGFHIAAAVENDPIHAATYQTNFPEAKVLGNDLLATAASEIVASLPRRDIDVVVGGPPCQGFSWVGVHAPGDPRNLLFLRFA